MNVYTIPETPHGRRARLRAMLPDDSLFVPSSDIPAWRHAMVKMHQQFTERRYQSRAKQEGLLIWRSR